MSPYTTPAAMPQTITGPAMVNIFAPTPKIKPSAAVNIGRSVFCRNKPTIELLLRITQKYAVGSLARCFPLSILLSCDFLNICCISPSIPEVTTVHKTHLSRCLSCIGINAKLNCEIFVSHHNNSSEVIQKEPFSIWR